eukprot:scaffold1522_cov340-Prasinococcus_capsulatus_cf.AAC.12
MDHSQTLRDSYRFEDTLSASPCSASDSCVHDTAFYGPDGHVLSRVCSQVDQYKELKTLLGEEYFKRNKDHRLRGCVGIVSLKVLNVGSFVAEARSLKDAAEGTSE